MDVASFGKMMPPLLLYPATLLALMILAYPFYRVRSMIVLFTLFALSYRYLAGAHHGFFFQASPVGMSWNALSSSALFLVGLLLIRFRHLLLKPLIPFYLLIIAVVLSALANRDIPGAIDVVVKFGYLIIITICVYESMIERGEERTMSLLLWAMVTPVLFQLLSIAFGIAKSAEADGSTSYIGGYNHEGSFSIILATGFVMACFATDLKLWLRSGILLTFIVALILANYRTTLVALAPLVFVQFNLDILSRFVPRQRIVIGVAVLAISTIVAIAAAWFMQDRFADLVVVLSDPGSLIKEPEFYTPYERSLMSARPYIWSGYISAWLDGSFRNTIFGFGPDSWIGVFNAYAHNTLVSALYEYGAFGLLAMIAFWASMIIATLRIRRGPRGKLIAAHASFFLLNMATMPHWLIEGNILYGIICGYTFFLLLGPGTSPVQSTAAPAFGTGPLPRRGAAGAHINLLK